MLYFAYGSNMATRTMRTLGDDWELVSRARLDDYRLAFTRPSQRWGGGAADVISSPGQTVWGVLYRVGPISLAALDEKEGLGVAYRRIDCQVRSADGTIHVAMTYTVIDKADPELCPAPRYTAVILEGAVEHALPQLYIQWLRTAGQPDGS